ncbi:MAG: flagellar biosynthesis protein FliQ [Myxococcales bacterium]|nr:flagellar biosynthesis protein FliQ [Myxococcales bacterium]
MNAGYVISFFHDALMLAAMLSLPALALGLVVGLMVSIFQAVTQINEQTLTIIPKIAAIIGALLVTGNWMLAQMMTFTTRVFTQIATLPG